jgi:hypothetical protein
MIKAIDLNKIFPIVTFKDFEKKDVENIYNIINISVFDHILNIDEANERITPALNPASSLNKEYYKKFFSFYAFFHNYDKVSYIVLSYNKENDEDIFKYNNINNREYDELCKSSFAEIELMKILIPYLGCMICGGFDFTNTIYVNKQYDLSIIIDEVGKHGLFIIE